MRRVRKVIGVIEALKVSQDLSERLVLKVFQVRPDLLALLVLQDLKASQGHPDSQGVKEKLVREVIEVIKGFQEQLGVQVPQVPSAQQELLVRLEQLGRLGRQVRLARLVTLGLLELLVLLELRVPLAPLGQKVPLGHLTAQLDPPALRGQMV